MSNVYDLEYLDQNIYSQATFKTYPVIFGEMNTTINSLISNTEFLDQENYLGMINCEDEVFKFWNSDHVNNPTTTSSFLV
jgi:hypothetical protein